MVWQAYITGPHPRTQSPPAVLTNGLAAGSTATLRARIEGGVTFRLANGASLTGEGIYDGIGTSGLDMYGGSVRLTVPVN